MLGLVTLAALYLVLLAYPQPLFAYQLHHAGIVVHATRPIPDAMRATLERERRQVQAEALMHGDPVVQQLLAQFEGARIVPGSIKSQ